MSFVGMKRLFQPTIEFRQYKASKANCLYSDKGNIGRKTNLISIKIEKI